MIKISPSNLQDIADKYLKKICIAIDRKKKRLNFDYQELDKEALSLYLCPAENLHEAHERFKEYVHKNFYSKKDIIKNVYFDYNVLFKKPKEKTEKSIDYWLMEELKIQVCPYCNRSYTTTIKNSRPQIDHFYPQRGKNAHPYLALSFYNLIPSCPVCNYKKRASLISSNPYAPSAKYKFIIEDHETPFIYAKTSKEWEIKLESSKPDDKNITVLSLEDFYAHHKDIVEELVQKAYSYKGGYYDGLIQTFAEMGLRSNEIQTLIFGTPIQEEDLGKRPLSKLTKDILAQLEIY